MFLVVYAEQTVRYAPRGGGAGELKEEVLKWGEDTECGEKDGCMLLL